MADLRREMDRMLHEVLGRHRDWFDIDPGRPIAKGARDRFEQRTAFEVQVFRHKPDIEVIFHA